MPAGFRCATVMTNPAREKTRKIMKRDDVDADVDLRLRPACATGTTWTIWPCQAFSLV